MKKLIWCVGMVVFFAGTTEAQTKGKKKVRMATKSVAAQTKTPANTEVSLTSIGSYAARGAGSAERLAIADPTINTFNTRVFTGARMDNERAIIGLPKIRTGLANGHILLYPTTSATSGTNTGSGTVGTGTSIGNVGTNEAGIGVNGKNPYAGPGIYGTRVINDLRPHSALAKPVTRD
jgi:hypothetical protein